MFGDLDVVHTCGVEEPKRFKSDGLLCRCLLRFGGRPFSFYFSCAPSKVPGTQNLAPRHICFAKTNGNRAEFDRVGFSVHHS